ncbi:MAG: EAL domain-containing protein [Gammaproteobacteria bacterium]|nr:EAL domain-containing protein [Gammaproteobacteria bacterium]
MQNSKLSTVLTNRDVSLILVVDDDPVIRSMLRKALERQAYNVIEADNGLEAIELFRHQHPDMVLLDVLMPVMNGFQACETMRIEDPERSVPVIMLTGLDDVSSVDRAFEAGATDFITKPINWSLFTQRVRYALKARDTDFALRKSQRRINHALHVAKLGYWDWDLKQDLFKVPESVLIMLGIDARRIEHVDDFIKYVPVEDKDRVQHAFRDVRERGTRFVLEHRLSTLDRSERYLYQQCDVMMDDEGRPLHAMGTIQDITALKRAEDMILHQAYHDSLTDLANQTLFKERLTHALKVAEHGDNRVAVIVMDIDRFQLINESLGHDIGNELLVAFAGFLGRFVQEGDTVSRISGNEFAILLETPGSMDEITDLIRSIRQALKEDAFELVGEAVYISLSMGVSIYPDDDFDAGNLMKYATAAMRKAKAQGGDQEHFYTIDMNRRVHDRLRMEQDLRKALDEGSLELYYQPQVDAQSRKIVAAEALIRWNHPQSGQISPAVFIPLAEETGLIQPLGSCVLKEAMSQTKVWHDKGYALRVGINLSARQFQQKDLLQQVEKNIIDSGLDPAFIELEITESIAMQDAESSIKQMHELKKLGIHLSMDDFGTGYSSLSYLNQFPLDVLKIDRAFVKDIEGEQGDSAIVRAVIAMAQSMGLDVIAEGVESEQQFDFLRQHGCQLIQGYLISKPVSASDFEKLLASQ